MGLLNSALHIGRTGILSYQSALEVVGSNISNAATPGYSRLSPQIDPVTAAGASNGIQPGAGSALTNIQRHVDEALESRLRFSNSEVQSMATQNAAASQVEQLFNDFGGTGLSLQLTEFFATFDELQNNPLDISARNMVVVRAEQLANAIQSSRAQIVQIANDIDGQIGQSVSQVNEIASKIADINRQITTSEAGFPGQATALRDQRNNLLNELSSLLGITAKEQPNGSINVYLGSEVLVQNSSYRELEGNLQLQGGFPRTSLRFKDSGGQPLIQSGSIRGLMTARDQYAIGQVDVLDQFANGLIQAVNTLHADGQPSQGFTSVTSNVIFSSTALPLNDPSLSLPFLIQHGSFYLSVAEGGTNTSIAYRIPVSLDGATDPTTLQSLVDDINQQVSQVTASISPTNQLQIVAEDGFTFTFGHDGQQSRPDSSGLLAALGINTFFSGTDATNIAVASTIKTDPSFVAASAVPFSGDGMNAGQLAQLGSKGIEQMNGMSVIGFYDQIVATVAIHSEATREARDVSQVILSSLTNQRDSISGVNLDEEAISLIKFERAFQGAARYLSSVDQMLRDLIAALG